MFKNPTINFDALFNPLGNSTCSSPEVVLAFLLYEGGTIHNASDQFISCVYFFFVDFASHPSHRWKSDLYVPTSNSCIFTPIENWTHVYMNLFTRNSPYYHLLKYLLFLLKHPVSWTVTTYVEISWLCTVSFLYVFWSYNLKKNATYGKKKNNSIFKRKWGCIVYVANFMLFELCIVIFLCNKNQQNTHFLH